MRIRFVLNRPVDFEETRLNEFKEIRGGRPLDAIKNTCDEYVVAFLNSAGGSIFWGIRDSDRNTVGVFLSARERDELRRIVTNKLNQIQPPISPTAYQINLHPIYEDETLGRTIEGCCIVEVVAPQVFNDDLYSTGSGAVFVKTDSGKRKLTFQEIQDEIRRREHRANQPSSSQAETAKHGRESYGPQVNLDSADNFNVVAAKEALKLLKDSQPTPEFSITHIHTPAELNDLWSIDCSAYVQSSIGYDVFHEWWKAFPQGLRVLFYGNYIVGAMGIWPLSQRCCELFKQARLKEAELSSKMFRSFRNKRTANWYISGIVLRPEFRRTNAIRLLISDGLRTWLRESLICYPLELLALGYSTEGQALLERFGFVRFQNASVMPDSLPLYRIEVKSQIDLSTILEKRGLSSVSEYE